MPINYTRVNTIVLVPEIKTCNKCKRSFRDNNLNDKIGWQEFVHIQFTGGYGSIFGDGAEIECNLCQNCFKELFGPYLEVGPDWTEEESGSINQEAKNFKRENG